jgi:excisionase family DNA binding protein
VDFHVARSGESPQTNRQTRVTYVTPTSRWRLVILADWIARIEQLPACDLPALLGELEQAKAKAWARLVQPASLSAPPTEDYTAEGLATHLKLTKGTVYRLYRAGVWPNAYKVGRTKGLRIPRADVEAWRAAQVERPRFELIRAGKRH